MTTSPLTWIFDLDNTLHNATPHIFPHINRAMTAYIQQELKVDAEEAGRIRQTYWYRYGATLLGLMHHHQIDPQHFLWETHQFPALKQMVVFDRAVKALIQKLPGRKIIYSNAPAHYMNDILDIMGMDRLFDAVYSVESTRFQPKPSLPGFRSLIRQEGLNPHRCIMVEDSLQNLVTAKRLGMKTLWISSSTRQSSYVDLRMPSLLSLPRHLHQLYSRY